jgi:hypothetical protein
MKPLLLVLTGILLLTASVGRTQERTAAPDAKPMMMSMQASDARLDQLVADLNAARGAGVDVRLDKVIAVVNELVAERKKMQGMMRMMHGEATPKDDHSAHHPESGK